MDLKPFLKSLFGSFLAELHSKDSLSLQREIAEGFLTYFGQFSDGEIYILDDGKLSRLSAYELAEELPFTESQIEEYLKYTKSISLNTHIMYDGIYITPNTSWAIGGINHVFDNLNTGKISYFTFPVYIDFNPSISLSYTLSVTLSYVQGEGIYLKVNPDSVREIEDNKKKYNGYYASVDGTMDAEVVINKFDLNFNLGNVLKYIIRAGKKDPSKHVEDLEKAKKYIEFEIAKIKGE